jgi:hypothetical protein
VSGVRGASLAISLLATAACLAACGEQGFTADELVGELNDHGAGLELGEALPSTRDGIELHALRFATDPAAALNAEGEAEGGSGSITITSDADAGLAEYQRCEGAGALVCFRAANAVLIFEDEVPADDRARLATALRAVADG